jgi:hypothetical protein
MDINLGNITHLVFKTKFLKRHLENVQVTFEMYKAYSESR